MARSGKRKAPEDFSTNPHTVKERNRRAAMSDTQMQAERAKQADQANLSYHLRKLRASEQYRLAGAAMQQELEADLRNVKIRER
jgi:hypothetical protein